MLSGELRWELAGLELVLLDAVGGEEVSASLPPWAGDLVGGGEKRPAPRSMISEAGEEGGDTSEEGESDDDDEGECRPEVGGGEKVRWRFVGLRGGAVPCEDEDDGDRAPF